MVTHVQAELLNEENHCTGLTVLLGSGLDRALFGCLTSLLTAAALSIRSSRARVGLEQDNVLQANGISVVQLANVGSE